MDVPQSHYPGKKSWRAYFWEFLMLFLAVFCGFLAEYELEYTLERDRAKELSKSFYQELVSDSGTAAEKIKNRLREEAALNYLVHYFKDSSLTSVSKSFAINFEYGINFRTPALFEPRTVMLDELKSSGMLRYLKSDELQKLVGDLTVTIQNIHDRQEFENRTRFQYINPLIIQHYDYDFDAEVRKGGKNIFEGTGDYEKTNEIIPFHLHDMEKIDRQNLVNVLSFYEGSVVSSTRENHIQKYIEINAELLRVLRREYNLK